MSESSSITNEHLHKIYLFTRSLATLILALRIPALLILIIKVIQTSWRLIITNSLEFAFLDTSNRDDVTHHFA